MPDLAGVIAGVPAGNANMRIGTVTAYNSAAGTLTVSIAGTSFQGIFYAPSYLPLINDTVAVLNAGPTWYVVGSTVNAFARAGGPVGQVVGSSTESTASTTFTDLTTFGPSVTVTIGASGFATVWVSSLMTVLPGTGPTMGVQVSGANTIAPDQAKALENGINSPASGTFQNTRCLFYSGLNQGSTTFTAKYLSTGGSSGFVGREIVVIPS